MIPNQTTDLDFCIALNHVCASALEDLRAHNDAADHRDAMRNQAAHDELMRAKLAARPNDRR